MIGDQVQARRARWLGVFSVLACLLALMSFTILIGMAQLRVRIGSTAATLFGVWSVALPSEQLPVDAPMALDGAVSR